MRRLSIKEISAFGSNTYIAQEYPKDWKVKSKTRGERLERHQHRKCRLPSVGALTDAAQVWYQRHWERKHHPRDGSPRRHPVAGPPYDAVRIRYWHLRQRCPNAGPSVGARS